MNNLNKIIVFCIVFLLFTSVSLAKSSYDNFARDMGSIVGSGTFNSAQSKTSLGFNICTSVSSLNMSNSNIILKSSSLKDILILVPIAQFEIHFLEKVSFISRYTTTTGSYISGAGIRYYIHKSEIPDLPNLAVQTVYSVIEIDINNDKLKADTSTTSIFGSVKNNGSEYYLGISYDSTNVKPESIVSGIQLESSHKGIKIETGVNIKIMSTLYTQLGFMLAKDFGYNLGIGYSF